MAQRNKTRYAIMSLLSERPRTGYDIKKALEEKEIYFWSESYGQIYPILHKLAEEGLADKKKAPTERHPNRTVYQLSQRGREELVEWLKRPADTIPLRIELLLKLRYGALSTPEDNLALIEEYREGQLGDIDRLEEQLSKHTGAEAGEFYARLTLQYGIELKRALVRWCAEALAAIEQRTEQPGGYRRPPVR
ncbi:MAG: PadR family transcriptional regulator [Candidatus Coatesbacteria bacterium]|nr:PadR family transcriptional regulator [Candidatus Coatesbacteria bacterium]